ncbi:hypothetical protein WX98_18480 [Pseudomonas syringae pv. persicae]|nr:hypothetical protein WX98_18480 [Pseudomonas syringae pv. persicae]
MIQRDAILVKLNAAHQKATLNARAPNGKTSLIAVTALRQDTWRKAQGVNCRGSSPATVTLSIDNCGAGSSALKLRARARQVWLHIDPVANNIQRIKLDFRRQTVYCISSSQVAQRHEQEKARQQCA